jgi:hypothetical protein
MSTVPAVVRAAHGGAAGVSRHRAPYSKAEASSRISKEK